LLAEVDVLPELTEIVNNPWVIAIVGGAIATILAKIILSFIPLPRAPSALLNGAIPASAVKITFLIPGQVDDIFVWVSIGIIAVIGFVIGLIRS